MRVEDHGGANGQLRAGVDDADRVECAPDGGSVVQMTTDAAGTTTLRPAPIAA